MTLAKLAAALLFGLLWTTAGLETAALAFALGLILAMCVAAATVWRLDTEPADA